MEKKIKTIRFHIKNTFNQMLKDYQCTKCIPIRFGISLMFSEILKVINSFKANAKSKLIAIALKRETERYLVEHKNKPNQ